MKSILMLLVLGALFHVTSSNADSKIVYSTPPPVVKGTVKFPGYGEVLANKACVTDDKQILKATVPAEMKKVCLRSVTDRSDSTHPVEVCKSYDFVHEPKRELETPVTTTEQGCFRSHVDRSDSTHPLTVCDKRGLVQVSQSLTYLVYTFPTNDFRHDNPTTHRRSISICK